MGFLEEKQSRKSIFLSSVFLLAAVILTLQLMGRPWLHQSGILKFWQSDIYSPQVSQHLTDWYTLTHFLHGVLLYGLLCLIFPGMPVGIRLVFAIALEGIWEIVENTDYAIRYYRNNTMAIQFYGDTILNSFLDQLAMIMGFITARKIPVLITVVIFIATELTLLYFTRDSFLLNILMLLYPVEAIKNWQMPG